LAGIDLTDVFPDHTVVYWFAYDWHEALHLRPSLRKPMDWLDPNMTFPDE
jgi:hypothetical protein